MSAPATSWYDDTLASQQAMVPETWSALQAEGVDEATKLRLEFFYEAPDEAGAQSLATLLRDETDYEVEARSLKKGMLSKRSWVVTGKTQAKTFSLSVLTDWVTWMVAAGAEHGACRFDGFGCQLD